LVEVTHRRDPQRRFEWVALLNHSGHLASSIHEPIPINHLKVQLQSERRVKRIRSLANNATLIPREIAPDEIEIVLPRLNVFEIVLLEYDR
jgi:hypothetical protein